MNEERMFSFTISRGVDEYGEDHTETYQKNVSELNGKEKDLLLGEFIHHWDTLPAELQIRFMTVLTDYVMEKQNEHFINVLDSLDKTKAP
jgi:hypothetical protein